MSDSLLLACSTCAFNFREAGGEAAGWSILFLLGLILPLLGLIGFYMFRIIRRGEKALDPELRDEPIYSDSPLPSQHP